MYHEDINMYFLASIHVFGDFKINVNILEKITNLSFEKIIFVV